MVRQIIHIDEEKCNGCGLCANACHESAIEIVNGKAKLIRDDYCDGLGNCLPACPTGAISFIEREAAAYDEEAVKVHVEKLQAAVQTPDPAIEHHAGGCPGSKIREMNRLYRNEVSSAPLRQASELRNWPVQIKLAPTNAPYFEGADLLIAADCTAYSYASFHQDYVRGRVTLIGCTKLDNEDYSEKLTEIIARNDIRSITVLRMEVPCCGGMDYAVTKALQNSGKSIPMSVTIIGIDGEIISTEQR